MASANDSTGVLQIAPETSYAVPPSLVLTISGGTPAGTFTLTVDGQVTTALAFNLNAAGVKTAVELLSTVGSGNSTCTGTIAGGMTIVLAGYRAALPVTLDATLITGGATSTLTGGPVWVTVKATKWKGKDKTAVKLLDELRNSPDPFYDDSIVVGGQVCDWTVDTGLRADQTGHFCALNGFQDSVATASGVTTHTLKPGTVSARKSYCIRSYNGLNTRVAIGLIGTGITFDGKGGEGGQYDVAFKGWSHRRVKMATNPTATLPTNAGAGSYRRISPTNSGVSLSVAGSVNSLVQHFKFDWAWETKPLYTQTGVTTPYRPECGKRHLKSELDLLFDDDTEYAAAIAAIPATEALAFTCQGIENISGGVYDTVNFSVPANLYTEPDIDDGFKAPVAKLGGHGVYNTSAACAFSVVIKNATAAAYS